MSPKLKNSKKIAHKNTSELNIKLNVKKIL